MTAGPVSFNLPSVEHASAYRESLVQRSQFVVDDFGTTVAVRPREGAGATREWFTAYRLCDDQTGLTDETWEPLRRHQSTQHPADRVEHLLAFADELAQSPPGDLARQLTALRARVFALGPDLPRYLHEEMQRLFPTLPRASLWFVATDEALLARFAVLRSQLALTLTPDIRLDLDEFEGLRLFGAHSLSDTANFAEVFALPTLVFSPAVTAIVLSTPPHALVLFFGAKLELRRQAEESFSELFRPRILNRAFAWTDEPFWDGLAQADAEALLPWWVERLNVLYSHASDPTSFADRFGRHDPAAQTAWFLTLERALADATLLLGDPNHADVARFQMAFDLLDKCESLLGYSKSGPGFKELLRRTKAVPRLNQAWAGLPGGLERRFRRHTRLVYDTFYDDVREHALRHRRTKNGMLVATEDSARPRPMSMDDYVSRVVREVRNSAHGLSRQLRGRTGMLMATHDGDLPTQLTDIAKLILFALVADSDKLCAGEWW